MIERHDRRIPEREKEADFIAKTKSISLRSQVVLDGYIRPAEKITKAKAIELGEQLYWPDKPCRKGHEYWRIVSRGRCLACEHTHIVRGRPFRESGGRSWYATEARRERLALSDLLIGQK